MSSVDRIRKQVIEELKIKYILKPRVFTGRYKFINEYRYKFKLNEIDSFEKVYEAFRVIACKKYGYKLYKDISIEDEETVLNDIKKNLDNYIKEVKEIKDERVKKSSKI